MENLRSDLKKSLKDIDESPDSMKGTIEEFVEETKVFEKYKEHLGKLFISDIIEIIRKDSKGAKKHPI
jgi:hypothetical protein